MKPGTNVAMDDFLSWDWTRVSVEAWRSLRFVHIATQCRGLAEDGGRCGTTLWAADSFGSERIGLAWEWFESDPGSGQFLASVQDLMSNAVLTDDAGREIANHNLSTEFLKSVASLPWQNEVVVNIRATSQ